MLSGEDKIDEIVYFLLRYPTPVRILPDLHRHQSHWQIVWILGLLHCKKVWCSSHILKSCKRGENFMDVSITCFLLPPHMTGHVVESLWGKWKFYYQMVNHSELLVDRSLQHRLNTAWFAIVASSHTKAAVWDIRSAHTWLCWMGDMSISFPSLTGTCK